MDVYTLGFTEFNVRVVGDPVIPEPVTSPTNIRTAEGTVMLTGVMFVTNPLLLTVTLGTIVADPYVPGAAFTVANVNGTDPGPVALASPVRADM